MTLKATKPKPELARVERAIAALALAYPEVTEDRPWGHRAFKIRGKTFLFLGADADGVGLSVKLPESGVMALELPFTEPTHYGLGKSGWVSATLRSAKDAPLSLLREWLDESFRAIAPNKLVATLVAPAPSTPARSREKSAAARRTPRAAPKKRAAKARR
jgi:predicted DNA-binding protein (MmcQ/YjbR family)